MIDTIPTGVRPIAEVADELGVPERHLTAYGRHKAKVALAALDDARARRPPGRLVLVSAITPTAAGEGKTTTTIGLGDALRRAGASACLALREPSIGPCMGSKGGGTGGGRARLHPEVDINLHFNGDFHAVAAAHNQMAALLDNHIHQGDALGIDPRRILWRRVADVNDRALRDIVIGLGGPGDGVPRETGYDITAASEVMAMLCLAEGLDDLRARLDRTLVAFTRDGAPVTAGCLGGTGAMIALMKDAIEPNLVQTHEGTPAFVHGGPFANIAHGCNSVLATRMAMAHADWAITEAGFGFDLGAEKFFDIKCVSAGLDTAAVVLVATLRALKMHGGVRRKHLDEPDPAAVERGLGNLAKHIENIQHFGERPIVAFNRFETDTEEELAVARQLCDELGAPSAVCDHFTRGGEGAAELAQLVLARAEQDSHPFAPLYEPSASVEDKILAVTRSMYGGAGVVFSRAAKRDLKDLRELGYGHLPVCIAKTQSSLSDDPKRRGRPRDFELHVERLHVNAGAGFLVVLTGDIVRMPGLPRRPRAEQIDVVDGEIVGLLD